MAPTAVHSILALTCHPLEKPTPLQIVGKPVHINDVCNKNHESREEAKVDAVLESVNNSPL
jgi:hypothetical protein